MLKILMINYEFPPLGGGGGIAAKKLAHAFIEQGHQVDYITMAFRSLDKEEKIDGIRVHRVRVIGRNKIDTASMISMLSFPFLGFFKCLSLCKKNNYDFINSHFAIPSGLLGVLVARYFGIKHILSIHGGDIYDPTKKFSPHRKWYLRKIVSWVINKSDRIVAQSSNTKSNAKKYYRFKKNIEIIPLPYKAINFRRVSREQLGLKSNKKYIISIGRLVKRKGYLFLIKALALIKDKNIECLIIGEGPEKENLMNLANKIGVLDRVHFLGSCSKGTEEKFQYLANADIYVLSSVHEGFGIVLQEAMQVGLPIVSTNKGGQTDFLGKQNALLVTPEDENALKEAILRLLGDRELRDNMIRKNYEKLRDFCPRNIANLYYRIFVE